MKDKFHTITILAFFSSLLFFSSFHLSSALEFESHDIPGDLGYSWSADIADVDGDGDLDIFVANFDGNKLWINDGSANFLEHPIPGMPGGGSVKLVDIDQDGDIDILTGHVGSNTLRLWKNDGSLNFTQQIIDPMLESTYGISVGDIDGDGDLDIYAPSREVWGSNRLFINDGNLNFTKTTIPGDGNQSIDSEIVDIDSDGDLDIYAPTFISGQNKLWINDGLGNGANSFHSADIPGDTSDAYGSDIADINGDGDLDIVTTSTTVNNVWINDGLVAGNLVFHKENFPQDRIWAVDADIFDFDGDGDTDILLTRWDEKTEIKIQGKIGTGISSFIENVVILKDSASNSVYGDFNRDGLIDIYTVLYYGRQNKLFLQKENENFHEREYRGQRFSCRDRRAKNFSLFGRHRQSFCRYEKKNQCKHPNFQSFMIYGDRDGFFSHYARQNATEIKKLQSFINSLLMSKSKIKFAGPEDGIFLSLTKRGVKQLQRYLNNYFGDRREKLVIDGIFGPKTMEATNSLCVSR